MKPDEIRKRAILPDDGIYWLREIAAQLAEGNEIERVRDVTAVAVPQALLMEESFEIAFDRLYKDPHEWSTRPCKTCREISVNTGIEVGCVRYAKEREEKSNHEKLW